uniref:Zinc finger (CCCH type), RNA-binding motif and serine/arginine-rich 2 n=2 Tax=Danio rerio TaxID=7955 RepID=A0A8M1QHE8_DANRE|nr:U2 small nuclear ribonucleoprotein auxiliary factor 35 kDa subunit-related protein 2 isoform X1 [Danio rerio]XP_021335623.1 U2 small nuclear ribonucleoprotein auxiliary factor 35 kDa subunit-related protein 2 isoform X1 [Danio rerio]|eukprot:XP_001920562.1 U2 small nuclear ribonucleoprotein auxiliary factor 35 kDa subunit-related protein 2 isoform X1 [Danio rerio]
MTEKGCCSIQTETQDSENRLNMCETPSVVLSHKKRRAALKRERRKRKRQALAKIKEADNNLQNEELQSEAEDEDKLKVDEESERLHQEWMERERIAQEEFRLKKEREDAAQQRKEEEERKIKEEWEEQQRKDKEEREHKEQEKREREEAVQKMLDQAESQLENGGPWKNPDAPKDYGTEKDKANCPFFLKTGACRFGDRCSRKHDHPASSCTLMVRGMFVSFGMEQSRRDDYDTDASLEYSEEELHQQFLDFYEDALPEFKNAGRVVQFKVSCNFEPHLRGNVYVQYETEEQCKEAFVMFNGRWYAGRQLQCEFSPVTRWKTAICGLFDRRKCPKGKHCNFLHVFRNPDNEFWEADRDLHMSPDRGGGFSARHMSGRDGMWSQRGNSSERFQRRRTDRRSHSRERYSYRGRRSRSRERRSRSRERRSRSRERRSRSRERQNRNRERQSRSRSREKRKSENSIRRSTSQREQSRRSRSRSQSRDRLKQSDSADSGKKMSKSNSPEHVSKNGSVKRKSHRKESQSPENTDRMDAHHHKHSKKSKKKKKGKKKHKRKKSKSRSSSSSAGSDEESRIEGFEETPSKSQASVEECPAAASSTGSPEAKGEATALDCCNPEEEMQSTVIDALKSDSITPSE